MGKDWWEEEANEKGLLTEEAAEADGVSLWEACAAAAILDAAAEEPPASPAKVLDFSRWSRGRRRRR